MYVSFHIFKARYSKCFSWYLLVFKSPWYLSVFKANKMAKRNKKFQQKKAKPSLELYDVILFMKNVTSLFSHWNLLAYALVC